MRNILTVILFITLYSCSKYPATVESALQQAGSNRDELEKVLKYYSQPQDKLKLKAAYDLIGTMPGKFHFDNPETDSVISEFCKTLPELKKQFMEKNSPYAIMYNRFWEEHRGLFDKHNPILDISMISSELLIENIDMAFYVWENMPWAKSLSYEYFRDYILPYKAGNMKPERWRKKLFEQYKWVLDSVNNESDPVEACTLINDKLKSHFTFSKGIQPNSISQIMNLDGGGCQAACILAVYKMRAMGVPTHITSTLISGIPPFIGSHFENIVLTKDLEFIKFPGALNSLYVEKDWVANSRGKWYLEMDRINENWITEKASNINQVPPSLLNNKLVDITHHFAYSFNVKLKTQLTSIRKTNKITHAYLCVSTRRGGWTAIDFTQFRKDSITFHNINPGVYFPMVYVDGEFHQCAKPFKLLSNGEIKPILLAISNDYTQSIKLYRKYPMNENTVIRSGSLIGDVFEVANDPSFSQSTILHTIKDSTFHITDIQVNDPNHYKYIRYKVKTYNVPTKLAELHFYGKSESFEHELKGELVCTYPNDQILLNQIAFASDNDYFTWFLLKNYLNLRMYKPMHDNFSEIWFGYELDSPTQITKIRYVCRSDVNYVIPGHTYQLDYLDDATWIPIEQKEADNVFVEFDNVPKNKLYILRNLTEGKEEYFFTYENGTQVWW